MLEEMRFSNVLRSERAFVCHFFIFLPSLCFNSLTSDFKVQRCWFQFEIRKPQLTPFYIDGAFHSSLFSVFSIVSIASIASISSIFSIFSFVSIFSISSIFQVPAVAFYCCFDISLYKVFISPTRVSPYSAENNSPTPHDKNLYKTQ